MNLKVGEVADQLGESENYILGKGISSFLDTELREVELRIDELKQRHEVETPEKLEERIKEGKADEHPAWEEKIEWENLIKRKRKLEKLTES